MRAWRAPLPPHTFVSPATADPAAEWGVSQRHTLVNRTDLERLERVERVQRAAGVGLLALLAGGAAWLAIHSTGAVDRTTAVDCGTRYARAHTAAESLVVDGQRPRITKAGQTELACGALRHLAPGPR